MGSTAVVRAIDGRLAWYPPGASDGPQWLDEELARETLRAALSQRRMKVCFAAPGADVRLLRHTVAPEEKKHLSRSLPYMLEEAVAADVDDLHFSSLPLNDEDFGVAVCARTVMDQWQQKLADYPGILTWVPEPLLLPWQLGEWTLVLEDAVALVRTGQCEGFVVEQDLLPMLLQVCAGEQSPEAVIVYGRDQASDTALVPETLRDCVQWRDGDFYSALMLSDNSNADLNLLQGDYAPRLPLGRWYRQWRTMAALFIAAFALQLAASYADYRNLDKQNLALRGAVEQSYRQAYPRGAVVDAEKQLRRQLEALRGTGQVSGFISMVERVGVAVEAMPGTSIASINYSDKSASMRMNVRANNFEDVEQLRQKMSEAGLEAVMESSNAQDKGVRARLRVETRS
ncbi:MAG: general secretion pathway protein L [Bacteroidia bacterium]|jgi:general secretion pathway protein L